MSRIAGVFEQCRARDKAALVTYIACGDPDLDTTLALMHTLVDSGADIIELGVPFSDPIGDGPVIQQACERALKHDVTVFDVLDVVKRFRETDDETPVVLMGYLNPLEVTGYDRFVDAAKSAGADGVLTIDLPPEESHDLVEALRGADLDPIFLVAPTTTDKRLQQVCDAASGFVYYVSLKGVTGSNALNIDEVTAKLRNMRKYTKLPIGVGFGISNAEAAARVGSVSDAVVVGSAIVKLVEKHGGDPAQLHPAIKSLVSGMREAMDASSREPVMA